MKETFAPVAKQSLSERLAQGIRRMIQTGEYREGDRLPPIMELARNFGVGHPTAREALRKLEALGVVEIRHGSGVYVSRNHESLVLASPPVPGTATKKLLIDLIRSRKPLEMQSVQDAVQNATKEHLEEMRRLLTVAGENLGQDDVLHPVNMGFHRAIALASGNTVLLQILDVLRELFAEEQKMILNIFGSRERDHREHLEIFAALEKRDATLGVELMRRHLDGVQEAIERWNPEHHPVS